MSTVSRRTPGGATTAAPTLLDWGPYEYALSWRERVRALLEDSGGWTAEDQHLINEQARALLVIATTPPQPTLVITPMIPAPDPDPVGLSDETPLQVETPPPVERPLTVETFTPTAVVPKASRNGHKAAGPVQTRWSMGERLQELGYPEDVSRSDRIKVGVAAVERYRQVHGKAPIVADRGSGVHAKRVSLYEVADLPMVDAIIREMLGDPALLNGDGAGQASGERS